MNNPCACHLKEVRGTNFKNNVLFLIILLFIQSGMALSASASCSLEALAKSYQGMNGELVCQDQRQILFCIYGAGNEFELELSSNGAYLSGKHRYSQVEVDAWFPIDEQHCEIASGWTNNGPARTAVLLAGEIGREKEQGEYQPFIVSEGLSFFPSSTCEELVGYYQRVVPSFVLPGAYLVKEENLGCLLEDLGYQIIAYRQLHNQSIVQILLQDGVSMLEIQFGLYSKAGAVAIDTIEAIRNPDRKRTLRFGDPHHVPAYVLRDGDELFAHDYSEGRSVLNALLGRAPYNVTDLGVQLGIEYNGPSRSQIYDALLTALRNYRPEVAGKGKWIYDFRKHPNHSGTVGLFFTDFRLVGCKDDARMGTQCEVVLNRHVPYKRLVENRVFMNTLAPFFGVEEEASAQSKLRVLKVELERLSSTQWKLNLTDDVVKAVGADLVPVKDTPIATSISNEDDRCIGTEALSFSMQFALAC